MATGDAPGALDVISVWFQAPFSWTGDADERSRIDLARAWRMTKVLESAQAQANSGIKRTGEARRAVAVEKVALRKTAAVALEKTEAEEAKLQASGLRFRGCGLTWPRRPRRRGSRVRRRVWRRRVRRRGVRRGAERAESELEEEMRSHQA